MSNQMMAKASCLCSAVSLSTTSMNHHVAACHCGMCRKWSGGALLVVECGSDVSFKGEENIGIYQSSEWAERGFCNQCGTHLFYRLKQNHQYYIPVEIFDSDQGFVFEHQVFIDEKPRYYSFANETKNMTGAELLSQFEPPSSK